MPRFASILQLQENKDRLGAIEFLDLREFDLVTAHRKLGEAVKAQVQAILHRKLEALDHKQLVKQLRLARQGRQALEEKRHSSIIDHSIQQALGEYLACLAAWRAGTELEDFQHKRFPDLAVEGLPVSADDLALFLQNDNLGCQTGVYRENDGSVSLWHTEEDVQTPGSRFDKLRLATFRAGNHDKTIEVNAFIYPDLLPGPAYAWRGDHFVQAIDSLPLKPAAGSYMLANIVAWVTLYLGKSVEPEEVIRALGPFVDGYALTLVQAQEGQVSAHKLEFAGNQLLSLSLAETPGSFLFQVNILSNEKAAIALSYEDTERESRPFLEKRIARTSRAIRAVKPGSNATPGLFRLLASRLGGDYAYAN